MACSREEELQIVLLYESGLTIKETGARVGRSTMTVSRVLRDYNVTIRQCRGVQIVSDPSQEEIAATAEELRKRWKRKDYRRAMGYPEEGYTIPIVKAPVFRYKRSYG